MYEKFEPVTVQKRDNLGELEASFLPLVQYNDENRSNSSQPSFQSVRYRNTSEALLTPSEREFRVTLLVIPWLQV